MRGLTGLPAMPQAPTAGRLHPSPDTRLLTPWPLLQLYQRLLTPQCLVALTAPGTLDCPLLFTLLFVSLLVEPITCYKLQHPYLSRAAAP